METASLRVSFTPIVKHIQKGNPKCCLEIIPEVTAIENLEWTLDNDLTEYTIPMTYRIVIKKQNEEKDSLESLKVYHSCVDLLRCYSVTNITSGCGDVVRITSDNFMLNKMYPKTLDVYQMALRRRQAESDLIVDSQIHSSTHTIGLAKTKMLSPLPSISHPNLIENNNKVFPDNEEASHKVEVVDIYETCTETCEFNTIQETDNDNDIKHGPNVERRREYIDNRVYYFNDTPSPKTRLSLSPICSVNTYDYPSYASKKSNQSSVFRIYQSEHKVQNITTGLTKPNANASIGFQDTDNSQEIDRIKPIDRVSPEVRVAFFMGALEREIFPLKLLLNEIRTKCATMGILSETENNRSISMYRSITSCNDTINKSYRSFTVNDTKLYRVIENKKSCDTQVMISSRRHKSCGTDLSTAAKVIPNQKSCFTDLSRDVRDQSSERMRSISKPNEIASVNSLSFKSSNIPFGSQAFCGTNTNFSVNDKSNRVVYTFVFDE